jgi:excisionase family DNA binding protein
MRNETEPPIEAWPSKQEVIERLGIGLRTLERKIQLGEVRKDFRPTLGSKPIVVIHPGDVAKLERLTLKPIPGERQDAASSPPVKSEKTTRRHNAAIEAVFSRDELGRKLYLTLDEAAFLSGLSRPYLERQRDAGILPCFKDGNCWKIRRIDLERYDAATGTMAAWHVGNMIATLPNNAASPLALPDARH